MFEEMKGYDAKDWAQFCLYLIGTMAAMMILIHYTTEWYYNQELLAGPCGLCGELNPGVAECLEYINRPTPSFWKSGNNWSDARVMDIGS